jgi:hypothetical protein
MIRPSRGGNKKCNLGVEAATKFHENHRAIGGRAGDEDPANIIEDCA